MMFSTWSSLLTKWTPTGLRQVTLFCRKHLAAQTKSASLPFGTRNSKIVAFKTRSFGFVRFFWIVDTP